jgi:hypothetical protein
MTHPFTIAPRPRRAAAAALVALAVTLAAAAVFAAGSAPSLLGLSIGAPESAERALGLAVADSAVAPALAIRRYELPDGGSLEVTVDRTTNQILLLQHLRLGQTGVIEADLAGFAYGRTTLGEIRKVCGSNGFIYPKGPTGDQVGDRFVLVNAYDIADQPLVVVFLTSVPMDDVRKLAAGDRKNPEALGDLAVLSGMILARRDFVEKVWGSGRMADDPCPAVTWTARK